MFVVGTFKDLVMRAVVVCVCVCVKGRIQGVDCVASPPPPSVGLATQLQIYQFIIDKYNSRTAVQKLRF
jgi:hypothetical protein